MITYDFDNVRIVRLLGGPLVPATEVWVSGGCVEQWVPHRSLKTLI